MQYEFSDFPCNNCGWCCQRTPCPVATYLGQAPLQICGFLKETEKNKFECGLLLDEEDPLKKEALKTLLHAGEGCSHIYGPHPVSLLREVLQKGISPTHPQWEMVKQNTINEYKNLTNIGSDPDSVVLAIHEFLEMCTELEGHSSK